MEFKAQLDQWHDEDEHEKIIEAIKNIPQYERDLELILDLACALNNMKRYDEVLAVLEPAEEQGKDNSRWHFYIGWVYYHRFENALDKRQDNLEKALSYLVKAMQLGSEGATRLVYPCKRKIEEVKKDRKKKDYFFPEGEYQRYLVGRFQKDGFLDRMLEEYGHIYVDGPQISSYYTVGEWTVIPCPLELLSRGLFLDLMSWLTQEGEEAFAIALHPKKCYFARREASNRDGDTVFVEFDGGFVLRWYLPKGLINDKAYSVVNESTLEFTNMLSPCDCKGFLRFIGANELIDHFFHD